MNDDDVTPEEHDRRAVLCALYGWHYQRDRVRPEYDPPYVLRHKDDDPSRWLVGRLGSREHGHRWAVDMHIAANFAQVVSNRFVPCTSFDEALAYLIREVGHG